MSLELAMARLNEALEVDDLESFMFQLGVVIKARGGYTEAARAAGLNRTALYKIAAPGGNPALNTLTSLLASMGLRLSIKPMEHMTARGCGVDAQLRARRRYRRR